MFCKSFNKIVFVWSNPRFLFSKWDSLWNLLEKLIVKCHLYLNLIDIGSCLSFFNFICKKECDIVESECRSLIFEILKQSKIIKRFDLSDEFWEQFQICDTDTKKQMGLYVIENISHANIWTITVNPKEYCEKLNKRSINKKHNGVRQNTPEMRIYV